MKLTYKGYTLQHISISFEGQAYISATFTKRNQTHTVGGLLQNSIMNQINKYLKTQLDQLENNQ